MIRSVAIPPRLGCTPGGNCCADCSSHKQALQTVQCDQDGNCYTDGVLTSSAYSGPPLTGSGSGTGMNTQAITYVIAAIIGLVLLESFAGRK